MKNFKWLQYTYKHRRAFEYCVRKLITDPALLEEMLRRAQVHDMDKMIMYLFLDQEEAQALHVATKAHHLENGLPKEYEDLVETVIDYECAPYTKPDKPLNAYDFTRFLVNHGYLDAARAEELFSIMRTLGIDHSGTVSDAPLFDCPDEVTEEMILQEILEYVNRHPDNELCMVLNHWKNT